MKKIITLTILSVLSLYKGYSQIPGYKMEGPITIFDTLKVYEGDTLYLGKGSDPRTGDFVFIYTPMNVLLGTPQVFLHALYSHTKVQVKFFKSFESRKIGKKVFTVADFGGLNNVIELEGAITSGEIIRINSVDVAPKPKEPTVVIQNQVSVADELTKLKKLLTDSIITQQEFDEQKKKLLEK